MPRPIRLDRGTPSAKPFVQRISRILHFGLIGGPKSNQLETNPGWTCRISRKALPGFRGGGCLDVMGSEAIG
jgi:hypothetical protein